MTHSPPAPVVLDGRNLTISDLVRAARDPKVKVECAADAMARVEAGWGRTLAIVERYKQSPADPAARVYGVTTGFGEFKDKNISAADLEALQRNILLSHAAGVGENCDADDPSNYYSGEVVRAALALRMNTFLRGHSGVSPALVRALGEMINLGVIPRVPLRGSVGSSGDLCPLCHTFVVMMGVGYYHIASGAESLVSRPRDWTPATELPASCKYLPSYKEGIALSNGATYSAAMLALAAYDAELLAKNCDIAAALTLEAMLGRSAALDDRVHKTRGMRGQADAAAGILALVEGSSLINKAAAVQDAYSLRCAPQVHGASRDAISYVKTIVNAEINAVTDNPLFFDGEEGAISQGNFHGQPVALAADFLTIAVSELANISERRTQMLLDRAHNRNLPANLVPMRGLNSGWMIAQYTAASLVSENKVLSHPASVDSIPTSANSEDHNSMAAIAARKCRTALSNAQAALGIELLVAAQAVEWRAGMNRMDGAARAEADAWSEAERERDEFVNKTSPPQRVHIMNKLGRGTSAAYAAIRGRVEPLVADRYLSDDLRTAREMVTIGEVVRAVEAAAPGALRSAPQITFER